MPVDPDKPTEPQPDATGQYTPQPNASLGNTEDHRSGVVTKTYVDTGAGGMPGGLAAGTVIAERYTLLEVIGEGGMGSVYLAQQTEPVKRQVALKLIKRGMDTKSVLARFEAERQALALMDHPNIARIFDGGITPWGQPYFVMELIQGVSITSYCDVHKLTLKARLELFVAVCNAVQHAHQKGIIHRDLKPGNVIVTEIDGRPTPKVIDFGVAKATEQKLTDISFADTGAIVGTPAYMSPEQADPTSMDIDSRTDVYALGVILYELLVGSPPIDTRQFKRGALLEMLRMVREVEPPRPSTKLSAAQDLPNIAANRSIDPSKLAKSLQGELDWVVMKALDKDRTRRYETANGFARDIQRYLADEVVEARPPSNGYKLRKFIRRHKAQVIAAGIILITLIGGIVGTSLGLIEAKAQKKSAEQGWGQAKTEQERAEQNFSTARALILDLGTRISQIETGQTNPKLADIARKQALDKAREQFEKFRESQPDDVNLQIQTALLHRFAANISRVQNDYPAAVVAYAAAVQIWQNLASRFPNNREYKDALALTFSDKSSLEIAKGKLKDATATLESAMKLAEEPRANLSNSAFHRTTGLIAIDQSEVAFLMGQFESSVTLALKAVKHLDELKTIPVIERQTLDPLFAAIAVHRSAIALREQGKAAEAFTAHDDAVARLKALAGPNASRDIRYWDCEVRRERALTSIQVAEKRAASLAELALILPLIEKLAEENSHVAFLGIGAAHAKLNRGELLLASDMAEPATVELTKSLAITRELIDRHGVQSKPMLIRGKTFMALGKARTVAGKNDEATAHWKNAQKVFELALKIDPDNVHHRRGLAEAEQLLKTSAKK